MVITPYLQDQLAHTFIRAWKFDDAISDKLIEMWKKYPHKQFGHVGDSKTGNPKGQIDKAIKDSIDISFSAEFIAKEAPEVLSLVRTATDEYVKEFQFSWTNCPWKIKESINVQRYEPNGGFKMWHAERTDDSDPATYRHMVFMLYLNDVPDEGQFLGGTEWFYQQVKIKAEKSVLLLWPADWTHTHRGIVSPNHQKYISTGWLSF